MWRHCFCSSSESAPSCFEVGPSPVPTRFEITAFGPLVPSVHEEQVLVGSIRNECVNDGPEPPFVLLGRRVAQDDSSSLSPRRVVPSRRNTGKPLVRDCRALKHPI